MGLLEKLQSLFESDKVDVRERFEPLRAAVSGTMSTFYKARDRKTGQIVGLKIADPKKVEAYEARFKQLNKPSEGEIAASFDHPRIVKTYEYGYTTRGEHYLVMEYLDGPGLHVLIRNRSPLLEGNRLGLLRQMAEALAAVHEAGYIHRDICPRNYICTPDVRSLKLIDFGLTLPATPPFMQPGNRVGTPAYMAPEIVRRRPTDQRVDIFAFGVSAFQLLTGELPWPLGDGTGQAALLHDTQPPTDIRQLRPDLHPALAGTVMRCLAAKPDQRPDSANRLLKLLADAPAETA